MFELLVAVPRGGSRVGGFSSASLLRRVSYHQMMSSQVCMIANRDFEKLAVIGIAQQSFLMLLESLFISLPGPCGPPRQM